MTPKHTPGPWHYDPETETIRVREWKRNQFMGDYRGCIIASFEQSHGGEYRRDLLNLKPEIDANGHVVAAAPDMLEALEAVAVAYGNPDDLVAAIAAAMPSVTRAIAKAKGGAAA
jgi:hypothetical protein